MIKYHTISRRHTTQHWFVSMSPTVVFTAVLILISEHNTFPETYPKIQKLAERF
jgi:hypothetical protein